MVEQSFLSMIHKQGRSASVGRVALMDGPRVSHPQRPRLQMSARNCMRFEAAKRAAAGTAALRRREGGLGQHAPYLPHFLPASQGRSRAGRETQSPRRLPADHFARAMTSRL